MFDYVILVASSLGLVVNAAGLWMIGRRKSRAFAKSMFHDLLMILMGYDLLVVICCMLQFSILSLWDGYRVSVYPVIVPWLIPLMHIAVMSSVYSTILISLERYIRICYYCQLRFTSLLTEDNIKFYKLFVVVFPIAFYAPKFFEVVTDIQPGAVVDCGRYLKFAQYLEIPAAREIMSAKMGDDVDELVERTKLCIVENARTKPHHLEAARQQRNKTERLRRRRRRRSIRGAAAVAKRAVNVAIRNVTIPEERSFRSTPLRMNRYYYRIYYVGLNTLFASVLPLALLLFLNVRTAAELFKMGNADTAADPRVGVLHLSQQRDPQPPSPPTTVFATTATFTANDGALNNGGDTVVVAVAIPDGGIQDETEEGDKNHLGENVKLCNLRRPSVTIELCRSSSEDRGGCNNSNNVASETETALLTAEAMPTSRSCEWGTTDSISNNRANHCASATPPVLTPVPPPSPSLVERRMTMTSMCSNLGSVIVHNLRGRRSFASPNTERRGSRAEGQLINKSREKKLAAISLYICWLFIFCHAWKLIPTAYEVIAASGGGLGDMEWPRWVEVLEGISHTLITVNSSLNFFIYLVI